MATVGSNKAMDFQALYQNALQISTSNDELHNNVPALQHGLQQLNHQIMAQPPTQGKSTMESNKAHFFLAQRGFDADKLNKELNTMDLQTTTEPLEPLGDTDIEAYLRHHHELILVTALEESKALSIRRTTSRSMNQLELNWESEKKKLLTNLGIFAEPYEHPTLESESVVIFPSHYTSGQQSKPLEAITTVFTDRMRAYSRIIHDIQLGKQPKTSLASRILTLEKKASSSTCENAQLIRVWEFLESMLPHAQTTTRTNPNHKMTQSALDVLSSQYRSYIEHIVSNDYPKSSSLLAQVQVYVAQILYRDDSGVSVSSSSHRSWMEMYVALRAGASSTELKTLVSNHSEELSIDLKQELLVAVENNNNTAVASRCPQLLRVFHELQQQGSENHHHHHHAYQLVVLNMLLKQNPNLSCPDVCPTIEDFCWQRLSFAASPASDYALEEFQQLILHFGSAYFDPTGTRPLVYFQLLILCQRFSEAVAYYLGTSSNSTSTSSSRDLVVDRIHLALALNDTAALDEDRDSKLMVDDLLHHYLSQYFGLEEVTEALAYILMLDSKERCDPFLIQLIMQHTPDHLHRIVGSLCPITGTRQQKLSLSSSSSNNNNLLSLFDSVLEPAHVTELLKSSAQSFERQGSCLDLISATQLYILAADLGSVMSVFVTHLSPLVWISPSSSSSQDIIQERTSWTSAALAFVSTYLSQPWAQDVVRSEHLVIGQSFQTLLNLVTYFDLVQKETSSTKTSSSSSSTSLMYVEQLGLVPSVTNSLDDLIALRSVWREMLDPIRGQCHHVLVSYMETLTRVSCSREQGLKRECQAKAKAVVGFAGLMQRELLEGTNERLNRLEVMML